MHHRHACLAVLLSLAAAACSPPQPAQTPEQAAAARQAAREAQAQQKLVTYRKLLEMKNYDLAVSIGEGIVGSYAGTRAADEVNQTLPKIKAEGAALAEKTRLERLWIYQIGPQSGGTQSTASISNSTPVDVDVKLVLRRHSDWGDSAFLYAAGSKGFVCKGQCDVTVHFDNTRRTIKAYLPTGGEPALFIKDDTGFIAAMKKAKKITMDVELKTDGPRTLLYEVGGFDPSKWKTL